MAIMLVATQPAINALCFSCVCSSTKLAATIKDKQRVLSYMTAGVCLKVSPDVSIQLE